MSYSQYQQRQRRCWCCIGALPPRLSVPRPWRPFLCHSQSNPINNPIQSNPIQSVHESCNQASDRCFGRRWLGHAPTSLHARLFEMGGMTTMPSSRSTSRCRAVNGWSHIMVFMAGATRNGLLKSQARATQVLVGSTSSNTSIAITAPRWNQRHCSVGLVDAHTTCEFAVPVGYRRGRWRASRECWPRVAPRRRRPPSGAATFIHGEIDVDRWSST